MLIEIHMLKNYPPVNLNRDYGGAPKSCFFGGIQRGRISSQSLKRSWRTSSLFSIDGAKKLVMKGIRTRYMPKEAAKRLLELGISSEFVDVAKMILSGIANSDGTPNPDGPFTSQVIIYSEDEISQIVNAVLEAIDKDKTIDTFRKRIPEKEDDKKKKAKKTANTGLSELSQYLKDRPISIDIALFGRMVTSPYLADVDAAMQVAHAISTHAVNRESDYFTAVDDLLKQSDDSIAAVYDLLGQSDDSTGAGMIGDVDYNSCCYYEYAALDTDILRENLKNCPDREALMEKLMPVLLRAMAYTNPSGKQNTFAGQVLPDLVMVECKKDKIPLSYVNAFEEPVSAWGNQPNLVKKSIEKLTAHVDCMDHAYELPVCHRAFFAPRFGETHPMACEVYDQFSALAQACAGWLQEDDAP